MVFIHERENAPESSIFLGLGSNLGDRETNLQVAIGRIMTLGLKLVQASAIYETEPVGYTDQHWFLNQVLEMKPDQSLLLEPELETANRPTSDIDLTSPGNAEALLQALLLIETDMGRERLIPGGPRVMDIDLLLFGDLVVNRKLTPGLDAAALTLVVPHPRMHLRRFVLEPLSEIAPELVHPLLKKSYRQLLAEVEGGSVVLRRS